MRLPKISTPIAVLVLAGAVAVSAATGAVAGSLITGAQIKNGSITTKDVKDGSLKAVDLKGGGVGTAGPAGPAGVSGYEILTATGTATSNSEGISATRACPSGKKVLGATASLERRFSTAPVIKYLGDNTVDAFAINDNGGPDTVTLTVFCAKVG